MGKPLVYFDSCVFIEIIQKANDDRRFACEALIKQAQNNEIEIISSTLAVTEVNRLSKEPRSKTLGEKESQTILDFFENPYIILRTVTREASEFAHHLTRTHGLSNLDAIHVATAMINKVPVMYTYDGITKKRDGLLKHNLKLGTPLMRIESPPDPMTGTLFDPAKMKDPVNKPKK